MPGQSELRELSVISSCELTGSEWAHIPILLRHLNCWQLRTLDWTVSGDDIHTSDGVSARARVCRASRLFGSASTPPAYCYAEASSGDSVRWKPLWAYSHLRDCGILSFPALDCFNGDTGLPRIQKPLLTKLFPRTSEHLTITVPYAGLVTWLHDLCDVLESYPSLKQIDVQCQWNIGWLPDVAKTAFEEVGERIRSLGVEFYVYVRDDCPSWQWKAKTIWESSWEDGCKSLPWGALLFGEDD
ncbi:hypothetical protein M011DRAFT_459021 [Sporormia fimetaria CBS 119925]|uniref:Uncharacterized protein n=1 Tax=Sporormia fimetaria CBS 119925 TaxID=1340428 RepID=A0A6A6V9N8_9PLEO|nr:hypothetical protein M011DRAFT_459021 [Sporormia fimetaria CBS 119925]